MYISCTRRTEIEMARRVTTAEARRDWAKVLRSAERGTPVEVMRNGQPVAAVISIEQYRSIGSAGKPSVTPPRAATSTSASSRWRSFVSVEAADLVGVCARVARAALATQGVHRV